MSRDTNDFFLNVLIGMVRCHEHQWLDLTHHLEVPAIVVFIKYEQFLRNVEMHLFDYPDEYPNSNVSEVAAKRFQDYYLHHLDDAVRYGQLANEWLCQLTDKRHGRVIKRG